MNAVHFNEFYKEYSAHAAIDPNNNYNNVLSTPSVIIFLLISEDSVLQNRTFVIKIQDLAINHKESSIAATPKTNNINATYIDQPVI